MFTGIATWLGVASDDCVVVEQRRQQQRRHQFSQYVVWQLRRRNALFVNDDIERGQHVIDACIALGNTLRVHRERFGVIDDRPLADALVRVVLDNEGASAAASIDEYESFSVDYVTLDTISKNPHFDPVSTRIIDAWMSILNESTTTPEGTRVTSTSRRNLPRDLYDRWMLESLNRTTDVRTDVFQALNITYTAITRTGEADHSIVARQAMAPLLEQIDIMRRDDHIDNDAIRLDLTFNVELKYETGHPDSDSDDVTSPATIDDDDENILITAYCSLSYRIYAVDHQHIVVYEGQENLSVDDDDEIDNNHDANLT